MLLVDRFIPGCTVLEPLVGTVVIEGLRYGVVREDGTAYVENWQACDDPRPGWTLLLVPLSRYVHEPAPPYVAAPVPVAAPPIAALPAARVEPQPGPGGTCAAPGCGRRLRWLWDERDHDGRRAKRRTCSDRCRQQLSRAARKG